MKSKEETAFSKIQYELAYPEGVESHYWYKARAKIIFDEIARHDLDKLKHLEIGCGKGTMIQLLRERGLNIRGVELARIEPNGAVRDFITSGTNALHLESGFRHSVECILLLDVIEHIEDPLAFIQEIMGAFPKARHLLITVPVRQELWSNYDAFYGHFKRYDLDDLRKLESRGVTNIKTRYFFNTLYAAALLKMKISNNRQIKITAPEGLMRWLHNVIASYLMLEYRIMPESAYGSSIFSIMKRG